MSSIEFNNRAQSLQPLRFGGVPEAFNDPFLHFNPDQEVASPPAEFVPFPGGSGSMLQGVENGDVDAAFMLTECAVAAQVNGSDIKIVCPVVTSPLRWAICKRCDCSTRNVDGATVWGISRMGSGSHVMVEYLASVHGWEGVRTFHVCSNIQGLLDALENATIDAFLWEWYTTSPYVAAGQLKFVGEVPTPWGCFCAVVKQSMDEETQQAVRAVTNQFLTAAQRFKQDFERSATDIARKYGMTENDAKEWLTSVQYASAKSAQTGLSQEEEEGIKKALKKAGVI